MSFSRVEESSLTPEISILLLLNNIKLGKKSQNMYYFYRYFNDIYKNNIYFMIFLNKITLKPDIIK